MGLWQEKALFAGKVIYKPLLVVLMFSESLQLSSQYLHVLWTSVKQVLVAQRELCSWVAVSCAM